MKMIKLYKKIESFWFLLNQKIRFLLVGGFNTVLAYALFVFLLEYCNWRYPAVLITQYLITVNISIFTMRYFVFRSYGNLKNEYAKAWSIYLLLLGLNYLYLFITVSYLKMNTIIVQGLYIVISTILTFILHKKYSFSVDKTKNALD